MNVKSAKVGSEFLLLLWTDILEVLITEDHDSALCDEQGQLILIPEDLVPAMRALESVAHHVVVDMRLRVFVIRDEEQSRLRHAQAMRRAMTGKRGVSSGKRSRVRGAEPSAFA